jgi:hypothetical protein
LRKDSWFCISLFLLLGLHSNCQGQIFARESVRAATDLEGSAFWDIANYEIRPWSVLVDSMRHGPEVSVETPRLPLELRNWNTISVIDGYFEYRVGQYLTVGFVFHDSLGQTIVAEAPDPRLPHIRKHAAARRALIEVRRNIAHYRDAGLFGPRSRQKFKFLGLPFVEPPTPDAASRLVLSPLLQISAWGRTPGHY